MSDCGINILTVNNRQAKGIILTAESLLNLKEYVRQISLLDYAAGVGARNVVDNLEKLYNRID